MDNKIAGVLKDFQEIVGSDGGRLEFVDLAGDALQLRYFPGVNEQCATCVVSPEDLAELVLEAMREHATVVNKVELVP
ncbi:MAG: NifU family protein [Chloroflexi bacterium]|nr:NifU family protein [Chloroflexota bacterium]